MANNTTTITALPTKNVYRQGECIFKLIEASHENDTAAILAAKWIEYEHFQGREIDMATRSFRSFFWSHNTVLSCIAPIILWSVSFVGAMISVLTFFKRRKESMSARILVTDFVNDVLAAFFFIRLSVLDQFYDQGMFAHSHLLVAHFMYTALVPVNIFIECSTYLQLVNVCFDILLFFYPRRSKTWNNGWYMWPILLVVYSCSCAQRYICDVRPYSAVDKSLAQDGSTWGIKRSDFGRTAFFNYFVAFNTNFDFSVKVLTYMLNLVLAMLLTKKWLHNKQDRTFAKNFQVSKVICFQCIICMVVEITSYIIGALFGGINDNDPCNPSYDVQIKGFENLWAIKYSTYVKNFLEAIQIGYYVFPVLLFDKDDFKTAVSEIFRKMSHSASFTGASRTNSFIRARSATTGDHHLRYEGVAMLADTAM